MGSDRAVGDGMVGRSCALITDLCFERKSSLRMVCRLSEQKAERS
jgi:hypothetical protein